MLEMARIVKQRRGRLANNVASLKCQNANDLHVEGRSLGLLGHQNFQEN